MYIILKANATSTRRGAESYTTLKQRVATGHESEWPQGKDVVEDGVHLVLSFAAPLPCIQQLVDTLGCCAAVYESALSWVEDRVTSEDVAEPVSEEFVEQLAQTALQADGPNIAHRLLFVLILDERNNDAVLPGSTPRRFITMSSSWNQTNTSLIHVDDQ